MNEESKELFAMKIMNKKRLKRIFISKNKHAYQAAETEMAILKKLVRFAVFITLRTTLIL